MPAGTETAVTLQILTGDQAGTSVNVGQESLLVGRGTGAGLMLRDANASRRHAMLRALGDGTADVRDVGSANGTYVNGERIEQAIVRGGDQLQIGDTVMVVEGGDEDARSTRTGSPMPRVTARKLANVALPPKRDSGASVRLGTQDERGLRRETRINRVFCAGLPNRHFQTLLGFGSFVITLAAVPPAEQR